MEGTQNKGEDSMTDNTLEVIVDDLKEEFRSQIEDVTSEVSEAEYLKLLRGATLELFEFAQARLQEIGE
tara:strand:- start:1600 stop:1806 length:207 start_codon:yes stop_codon:yes gene_type:complete